LPPEHHKTSFRPISPLFEELEAIYCFDQMIIAIISVKNFFLNFLFEPKYPHNFLYQSPLVPPHSRKLKAHKSIIHGISLWIMPFLGPFWAIFLMIINYLANFFFLHFSFWAKMCEIAAKYAGTSFSAITPLFEELEAIYCFWEFSWHFDNFEN